MSFDQVGFREGADGCGAGMVQGGILSPGSRVCWSVGAAAGFVGAVAITQAW